MRLDFYTCISTPVYLYIFKQVSTGGCVDTIALPASLHPDVDEEEEGMTSVLTMVMMATTMIMP